MRLSLALAGLLFSLGTLASQGPPLALLGAPAPGAAPAEDAYIRPIERTWPSTLARSGSIRRMLPARLTGHTVPDVVVLDGVQPILMTAPGIHTHVCCLLGEGAGAYDVAVLRGRGLDDGSNPALDALAFVDDEGLRVWRRNPQDGVVGIAEVGGSEWAGVRLLATHPADPLVIFGIDDNGVIRVAEHTNGGYTTSSVTFPEMSQPIAIACVDWDGDDSTELAVLTRSGLTIVDRNGATIVGEEQQSATSGALTLVRGGTQLDEECLAWLTPASYGGTELRLRSSTTLLDQPLYRTFVGAAAADWSGDGNEELVLSTAANDEVTLLVNLSYAQPTFLYHPGTAIQIAVAASANRPANSCSLATADFDGDGDADLVAAIEPATNNCGITELRMVQSKLYDSPPFESPVFVQFEDLGHGQAEVTFTFTPGPCGSHTRMVVWPETDGELDPQHVFSELRARTEVSEFVVPIDAGHLGIGSYVLMMQPVNVVNGHVVEVAEASLAIMNVAVGGGPGGTVVIGTTPLPNLPPPPPEQPPPTPGP
jgi:hypothetical protein